MTDTLALKMPDDRVFAKAIRMWAAEKGIEIRRLRNEDVDELNEDLYEPPPERKQAPRVDSYMILEKPGWKCGPSDLVDPPEFPRECRNGHVQESYADLRLFWDRSRHTGYWKAATACAECNRSATRRNMPKYLRKKKARKS